MNRHEKRKRNKLLGLGNRALKLRCAGCNRVGRAMTHEHFFPRWLIEYADARREGITWPEKVGFEWKDRNVNPDKAVIPLCDDCNNAFGTELEGPVSQIFRGIDRRDGLSDLESELLVRWLWKFEGLQWSIFHDHNSQTYTRRFTLKDRVTTSRAFDEVRPHLVLAVAVANANDAGRDWPMGLDTPVGENAINMSGVFRRVALIVSLEQFADEIHPAFGIYRFGQQPPDRTAKIFTPPCTFLTARKAVSVTQDCADRLYVLHEEFGRRIKREQEAAEREGRSPYLILPDPKRIQLPPM
jgi:hypothetical protein